MPLSLSKAYNLGEANGGALLVQAVNPTAGMFAGDLVELRAEVGPGAALILTTPAASRVFSAAKAREGSLAITQQTFTVAEGGWLEFLPEMFIPQAHSLHRQETRLEIAPGGGLFFLETLAPGRVASGEAFAYRRLEYHAELKRGGQLVYRERNMLEPGAPDSLHGLRALFPEQSPYYVNGLFCPSGLALPARDLQEGFAELTERGQTYVGASLLRDNHCWAIRALTADSLALHRLLPKLRALAHHAMGRVMPNLRKL